MARTFSTAWHRESNRVSGQDVQLLLLEITHPDLVAPIRLVNDTQDLASNGETYLASAFSATVPADRETGLPRATLAFDNVGSGPAGNSLSGWIEAADGGRGAVITLRGVRRSAPDDVEFEFVLDLTNVAVTPTQVVGALGYEDLLNRPAVPLVYRPEVAPGLF